MPKTLARAPYAPGISRLGVPMRPDTKPLRDRIADANRELKLARRDGSAEWIKKAAKALDELIDEIPRTQQPKATAT